MRKTCVCCGKRKPEHDFVRHSSRKTGYTNQCRECKRKHDNAYYKNNPARRKAVSESKSRKRKEIARYVYTYLKQHPCVDCGEADLVVLDFDHVRGKKRGNVSSLKAVSLQAVQEEIEKCDVRCANCHRRKTAKQYGWRYGKPRKHK